MSFKRFLNDLLKEARNFPVYHSTSITRLRSILESGLRPYTNHDAEKLMLPGNKKVSGISTTRSFQFAKNSNGDVILQLNQAMISQNFKIIPVQYWSDQLGARSKEKLGKAKPSSLTTRQNEYEEFILTNRPIPPKVIQKILIQKSKITVMEKHLIAEIQEEFSERFKIELI